MSNGINPTGKYEQEIGHYRNQLLDQIYASYRDIDSTVLIVATGALVISIGLITSFGSLLAVWLIGISWASLLLTLMVHTLSHWFGIKALKEKVELVDEDKADEKPKWSKWVNLTNIASRVLLVIGVGCLAWYAFSNLEITPEPGEDQIVIEEKEEMMGEERVKTGLVPGTPPPQPKKKQGGIDPQKAPPKSPPKQKKK